MMDRADLADWTRAPCDVLVIGGGATGLGVAVQAALEGRQVVLVEGRDFASGTSSRSTKLLHGGVRYLAQGRIKLVREALRERAVVLGLAPHLAQPLPFVVHERSWWSWVLTVLGLNLYQWLAGRLSLGPTKTLSRSELQQDKAAWPDTVAGVRYWDGQFEDARLALALAKTAEVAGARVRNHTRVVALVPSEEGWNVTLHDALTGLQATLSARCVVNATGVWVDDLRQLSLANEPAPSVGAPALKRLVKPSQGVHLVVDRACLPLNDAVLVPRTSDGRVLFAVPWLGSTVIGTTDTPRDDAPWEPRPMANELAFLVGEAQRAFGLRLQAEDVKSVWVGLRPLVIPGVKQRGKTAQMSREHLIVQDAQGFLTVTGGKWTTYRSMAQEVMATLVSAGTLPAAPCVAHTEKQALFGAPPEGSAATSLRAAPGIHLFGSQAHRVLQGEGSQELLGLGLTAAMVRYCAQNEWAVTVEDMLARRWRVLFLDARMAEQMAPRVAQLLLQETGLDPALQVFLDLCQQYKLKPADFPV